MATVGQDARALDIVLRTVEFATDWTRETFNTRIFFFSHEAGRQRFLFTKQHRGWFSRHEENSDSTFREQTNKSRDQQGDSLGHWNCGYMTKANQWEGLV